MLHFSKLKIFSIIFVVILGILFFLPNLFTSNLSFLPKKKIVLGLDLQGGSYLLLEVNSKPLFKDKLEAKSFELKKKLRMERINYESFETTESIISFQLNLDNKENILKLLNENNLNESIDETNKELDYQILNDKIIINLSEAYKKRIKKNAMEQSLEIIRSRIDELGTREPTIIAQGEQRILIELPGIKNPKRIKEIIGTTAKLTFRFIADNNAKKTSYEKLQTKNELETYNVQKKLVLLE